MIVKMRQETFEALADGAIEVACVDPIIKAYKDILTRGGDFKSGLFKELSRGQQALFVFRAYYNHALKSVADFYWWSAYFIAQPERWAGLKNGLHFFGDHAALHVLESMEKILHQRNHAMCLENFKVSFNDLNNDPELMTSITPLYDDLCQTSLKTHQIIGSFIRNNPHDFVHIEMD
ncbi:hypothetical protein [Paenibacillus planticolens]|uniref:Uncharacterized protein n=1 Tax=Paenibacillus planticolens TaxID=2654976 RepID=A0ABX1ZFJ0_9BACL|nr:hypothetical protein [Paenibacillus planticolens]NOU98850.1 hypothetical protein [Paenibacillus planticolens]